MSADDQRRWDDRHRTAGASTEIAPPSGLDGFIERLPSSGRALDVACGTGAGSVWLAHRGFDVVGIDVSPVAIEHARAHAESVGLSARCTFISHDLDHGLPAGDRVDLVVCHRFNDPSLDVSMLSRLRPGGTLALTVLSEVGAEPGPFRVPAGDLVRRFANEEILGHREGGGEATIIVRTAGPEPLGRLD